MRTLSNIMLLSVAAAPAASFAAPLNFNVDHTSYSAGRGSRLVSTADAVAALAEDSKLYLSLSGGERRVGGERIRAARVSGTLRHDWSNRLSTRSSVSLATNGRVFARNEFAQDVSYKLTDSLALTAGGKYASYPGDHVTSWSGGAGYYGRGFSLTYRFSLLASQQLGRSHAQLASVQLKDPGGSGSTQLMVGQGTSLYDVVPEQSVKAGKFVSLSLKRQQPLVSGVQLNFGVNRSWYRTPTGNYRGTGLLAGVSFTNRLF